MSKLCLAQEPEADALLEDDPFALLVGMLLDQQVPFETAFAGPKKIADRMGGLDAAKIAEYDPDKFAALCSERPAVHRFPGSMAKRIQALAQIIVDRYDGEAGDFGKAGAHLSVADIVDAQSLGKVRSYKKQMKAAAKGKAAT